MAHDASTYDLSCTNLILHVSQVDLQISRTLVRNVCVCMCALCIVYPILVKEKKNQNFFQDPKVSLNLSWAAWTSHSASGQWSYYLDELGGEKSDSDFSVLFRIRCQAFTLVSPCGSIKFLVIKLVILPVINMAMIYGSILWLWWLSSYSTIQPPGWS